MPNLDEFIYYADKLASMGVKRGIGDSATFNDPNSNLIVIRDVYQGGPHRKRYEVGKNYHINSHPQMGRILSIPGHTSFEFANSRAEEPQETTMQSLLHKMKHAQPSDTICDMIFERLDALFDEIGIADMLGSVKYDNITQNMHIVKQSDLSYKIGFIHDRYEKVSTFTRTIDTPNLTYRSDDRLQKYSIYRLHFDPKMIFPLLDSFEDYVRMAKKIQDRVKEITLVDHNTLQVTSNNSFAEVWNYRHHSEKIVQFNITPLEISDDGEVQKVLEKNYYFSCNLEKIQLSLSSSFRYRPVPFEKLQETLEVVENIKEASESKLTVKKGFFSWFRK